MVTIMMVVGILNGYVGSTEVKAGASLGIMGNGTGGISINVNASPYTDFARKAYGKYAYTTYGCAWFASARVKQLTGKGDVICGSYNWYSNGHGRSLGFTTGTALRAPAILCWGGNAYNGGGGRRRLLWWSWFRTY